MQNSLQEKVNNLTKAFTEKDQEVSAAMAGLAQEKKERYRLKNESDITRIRLDKYLIQSGLRFI